jgi:four helix bundle protein
MDNYIKKPIRSFRDLEVYNSSYQAMILIFKRIITKLPSDERYDLKQQLIRSVKAIPRLIAEGFAKKHQKSGFQKYIDDAMAEVNETIVSLEQVKDLYGIEKELCQELIIRYDRLARQLFNLAEAWDKFKNRRYKPMTTP